MRYFESFAGVGGIGLGLPPDWQLVGVSEIDKYASQVLKYHYPTVKNYGDISKINWAEVPDFDVLTGGSPCQDFSIAGKRRGLSGTKSSLAWEFIRGLRDKQPNYFVWENVKGVMSSRGGWDFANLLCAFSESGYDLWWQVLNAKEFGVPQNRERIFVFGTRNGSPAEILFEREDGGASDELSGQVANTLTTRYEALGTGTYIGQDKLHAQIRQLNNPEHARERIYGADGIAPSLDTMQGGGRQPKILQRARGNNKGGFHEISPTLSANSWQDNNHLMTFSTNTKKGYDEAIEGDGINLAFPQSKTRRGRVIKQKSPTLQRNDAVGTIQNGKVRKLTPVECERLMSWPDNWTRFGIDAGGGTVEISDSQRYKMCGNGVVSAVVKELINGHLPCSKN